MENLYNLRLTPSSLPITPRLPQGGSSGFEFDSFALPSSGFNGPSNIDTNLYIFVGNNPMNSYDPNGLMGIPFTQGGANQWVNQSMANQQSLIAQGQYQVETLGPKVEKASRVPGAILDNTNTKVSVGAQFGGKVIGSDKFGLSVLAVGAKMEVAFNEQGVKESRKFAYESDVSLKFGNGSVGLINAELSSTKNLINGDVLGTAKIDVVNSKGGFQGATGGLSNYSWISEGGTYNFTTNEMQDSTADSSNLVIGAALILGWEFEFDLKGIWEDINKGE